MTHEERIRFAEILKQPDGTVIQEYKGGSWQTMKIEQCYFDMPTESYRLPSNYPREIWVNVLPQGFGIASTDRQYCEQSEASSKLGAVPVKYVLAE